MYLNSKEAWVKAEPTKYQKISRAPKKLDSGEFQKPRGRPPKGMSWDAKVGEWKNDGGEDEDEDEEDGAEEDEHQEDADDEEDADEEEAAPKATASKKRKAWSQKPRGRRQRAS